MRSILPLEEVPNGRPLPLASPRMFDWLKKKRRSAARAATPAPARNPGPARSSGGGVGGVGNLDDRRRFGSLPEREEQRIARIRGVVEAGRLELPQLPSKSLALIDMASRPGIEIEKMVEVIAGDPALASELLKTANSAMYAGRVPADTLHQAVMRVGVKTLRSMIFSVSMQGVVFRSGHLASFAEEVWRQAQSVGFVAREIAPCLQLEPERAFLIGLLHDVGKVALLEVLSKEARGMNDVSPAVVGRVFRQFHEQTGYLLAHAWRLSEELAAVAGCHHEYRENERFPRSAALARLSHRIDLAWCTGRVDEFNELLRCDEMDFLELETDARRVLLNRARGILERVQEQRTAA